MEFTKSSIDFRSMIWLMMNFWPSGNICIVGTFYSDCFHPPLFVMQKT